MNMRLLRYTDWTRVLLAFLISLTVLAGKPFGLFRRFRDDLPYAARVTCGGIGWGPCSTDCERLGGCSMCHGSHDAYLHATELCYR